MSLSKRECLSYYHLELYLFETVHKRFHAEGSLNAFDFFSIIIWKANRSKSKIAKRLLRGHPSTGLELEAVIRELTTTLHQKSQCSAQERLVVLLKAGFRLPMASAILTVLWPNEFSVYDVRVCEQLGQFKKVAYKVAVDSIWKGYSEFLVVVRSQAPNGFSLRDTDRYMWARSSAEQLESDIARGFKPKK